MRPENLSVTSSQNFLDVPLGKGERQVLEFAKNPHLVKKIEIDVLRPVSPLVNTVESITVEISCYCQELMAAERAGGARIVWPATCSRIGVDRSDDVTTAIGN